MFLGVSGIPKGIPLAFMSIMGDSGVFQEVPVDFKGVVWCFMDVPGCVSEF